MKRNLLIILALVVVVALVGCGKSKIPSPSPSPLPSLSPSPGPSQEPSPSPSPSPSPFVWIVYQDFEDPAKPGFTTEWGGWHWNATLERSNEHARSGYALKIVTGNNNDSAGCKIYAKDDNWNVNFNTASNHNISFWIYAVPEADNWSGVTVKIYDNSSGEGSAWSQDDSQYFVANNWKKISMPLSNFGSVNLSDVNSISIEFTNEGTYYIYDIVIEP